MQRSDKLLIAQLLCALKYPRAASSAPNRTSRSFIQIQLGVFMNTSNTLPDFWSAEPVFDAQAGIAEDLQKASIPTPQSDAAQAEALLGLLLDHSDWDADPARIRAALPHARQTFDGWDLCDALVALKVPFSRTEKDAPAAPSPSDLGLFIARSGSFRLAGGPFDPSGIKPGESKISVISSGVAGRRPAAGSVTILLQGLRSHIWSLLFASLAINLAGLLTPVFVILVYNRAIPAKHVECDFRSGKWSITRFRHRDCNPPHPKSDPRPIGGSTGAPTEPCFAE
ncbi:hypothetical protein L0Z65_13375 [Phaeobacter sp. BS52]|uniref:hypothetical protein n=1 Tax=Phaeobacter sp. BS52 TaxID=2907241 RepID=UPI00386BF49E